MQVSKHIFQLRSLILERELNKELSEPTYWDTYLFIFIIFNRQIECDFCPASLYGTVYCASSFVSLFLC